ncbi:MAG: TonB-dependent receptor, partial [Bacteroidota bacterium]
NIEEFDVFIYGEKNSFRMKDYHRLDIAANFSKQTKWGERTWTISVFNLYNRMNPYYYYYEKQLLGSTVKNGVFHPVYSALKLYQKTLLGIVPSISYSFKF